MCDHLIRGAAEMAWHHMVLSLPNREVIRYFSHLACRYDVRLTVAITRGGRRFEIIPTAYSHLGS